MDSYGKYLLVAPSANRENQFWNQIIDQFLKSTAKYKIESELIRTMPDRFSYLEEVKSAVRNLSRGDFLFIIHFSNVSTKTTTDALDKQINVVNFNGIMPQKSLREIESHKNYATYFYNFFPDDYSAGKILITELDKMSGKGKKNLLMLTGKKNSKTTKERERAVHDYIAKNKHITLVQKVGLFWSYTKAKAASKELNSRHEQIHMVWSASDSMARGFYDGLSKKDKQNKNIYIGGIDWNKAFLKYIKNNDRLISVGGHFREISMIIDLLQQKANGSITKKEMMEENTFKDFKIITKDNFKQFQALEI